MDILDDMGVSKLSAKVFSKVYYSFNSLFSHQRLAFFYRCYQPVSLHKLSLIASDLRSIHFCF